MAKLTESEYQAQKPKSSSTSNESAPAKPNRELDEQYRSLCKTSVVSAVFAVFAILTVLLIVLVPELGLMAAMIAAFWSCFRIDREI